MRASYYADIIEEAAAMWQSLAMNHGFVEHLEAGTFRKDVLEEWLHSHTSPLP